MLYSLLCGWFDTGYLLGGSGCQQCRLCSPSLLTSKVQPLLPYAGRAKGPRSEVLELKNPTCAVEPVLDRSGLQAGNRCNGSTTCRR